MDKSSTFFAPQKIVLICHTMQCNAMQCNAMQCNAMQCNAMQCNAMQCTHAHIYDTLCVIVRCSRIYILDGFHLAHFRPTESTHFFPSSLGVLTIIAVKRSEWSDIPSSTSLVLLQPTNGASFMYFAALCKSQVK